MADLYYRLEFGVVTLCCVVGGYINVEMESSSGVTWVSQRFWKYFFSFSSFIISGLSSVGNWRKLYVGVINGAGKNGIAINCLINLATTWEFLKLWLSPSFCVFAQIRWVKWNQQPQTLICGYTLPNRRRRLKKRNVDTDIFQDCLIEILTLSSHQTVDSWQGMSVHSDEYGP